MVTSRTVGRGAIALAAAFGVAGCQEPDLRLVALRGCGLDVELEQLRVTVRGDFPATPLVLSSSRTLPPLGAEARGITLEGLVGESAVEAVGRTARLSDGGTLPVYFAPPESRCAVPSQAQFRDPGAVGVGTDGHVLIAGGRDARGGLLAEVLLGRDVDEGFVSRGSLPVPAVGQVALPASDGSVWLFGGAGPSGALSSMVRIDPTASGDPVSDPLLLATGGSVRARAHAGGVLTEEDQGLVVGGCSMSGADGECLALPASVLATTLEVDLRQDPPHLETGPPLQAARFGAFVLAARDGTVFVVGGHDGAGAPVQLVERRRVGRSFEPFGPDWATTLGADVATVAVAGAALLEPSTVVVALEDGRLLWAGALHAAWIGPGDDSWDPHVPGARRAVAALAGDRIVVDDFVLPVGGLGVDLAADQGGGIDPARVVRLAEVVPGPARRGATLAALADGSWLMVGGRDPDTGDPAAGALVLRLRPALDGADERIPEVGAPAAGALVAHHPQVELDGSTVRLLAAAGDDPQFPAVAVHARGFRGRNLRLDVTVTPQGATPQLLLWQGAVAGVSLVLAPGGVEAWERSAGGTLSRRDCSGAGISVSGETDLRLDVRPEELTLRTGGEVVLRCPGDLALPASVGVGASGTGEVRVRDLRLARL